MLVSTQSVSKATILSRNFFTLDNCFLWAGELQVFMIKNGSGVMLMPRSPLPALLVYFSLRLKLLRVCQNPVVFLQNPVKVYTLFCSSRLL